MPEIQNRTEDEFARYSGMTTQELQQILREHASKPEGEEETSMEALLCIMEVLAQRRQAQNKGKNPEEALETFRKYYEEDDESSQIEREPVSRKKKSNVPRWIRPLVAAAAIVILIFSFTLTTKAFDFDFWKVVVKWTQETFHFGAASDSNRRESPNEHSTEVFEGLQAALDDYEITTPLVPTWLPSGYTETSTKVFDSPKQRQFWGYYQRGNDLVKIWICDYLSSDATQIEQSGNILEVYESGGVDYYFIENEDELRVAWVVETYECYISGSLSMEEMKQMIDSIEKG